ncbi:hypothetical protein D3218_01710 [Aureimonas flava]|uniref:Uncharacterized protein n=1 Tax=Aureimonas flava TaxID=2320271 RepID=A0A3A1WQ38_9HYPH|nr:hypothetical protein D3218_01710 [Aureimonas flava]
MQDDRQQQAPKPERLGLIVQRVLEPLDLADRPLFLQHLEAKAKQEGDFQTLRAIRDYRSMAQPHSTEPPKSA